ncbi:MAG TPA: Gfo/Idh/MocA family oxidoreductase [Candidatus Dormibacteraeota bacterium]|nr:Gfo/Idh/MocA family oxidoreductase [Candidatus Dormibacteraeota bacterium]
MTDLGSSEFVPLRVIFHRGDGPGLDYGAAAAPLLAFLRRSGGIELSETQASDGVRPQGHQVLVAASDRTPGQADVEALEAHLRAGGGVVLLGGTLGAWSRNAAFAQLAGWRAGHLSPPAELRLRPAAGGPLSARLDPEILIRDRISVGGTAPDDAEVLLTVPWHFADEVPVFRRRIGAGRLVSLGIGWLPATYSEPVFQKLVHRSIRAAAGLEAAPPVGVGLYGYGAIGREHADAVGEVEGLELRGIADLARERLAEASARFQVTTHPDARALLSDPSIDLVVVGVPPALHTQAVLHCLAAGKHVVCEKPFALRTVDADRMLAAAADAGRLLTVYQSRRWDADFVAMRDAVRRGEIGDAFYLEAFIGGYGHPCSFWHSHEAVSGGTIFDWGSHYFDWMLQLLPGEVVRVAASAHKRVWHDVTNADQVRVDVTFAGGEQASFLQSEIAAALKPKWYLLGTAGALVGSWRLEAVKSRAWTGDLVEEQLAPAESPASVHLHQPDLRGGTNVTELALPPRVKNGFYRNLADHLLLGEPLSVRAEEAKRNVAVMEAATRSAAQDGRPLELRA